MVLEALGAVPVWLLNFAGALIAFGLAFLTLQVAPGQVAPRAFAALMFSRGAVYVTRALQEIPDPAAGYAASRLFILLAQWSAVAGVYFACVFPERRTWLGRSRHGPWVLGALALGSSGVLLAWPEVYGTYRPSARGGVGLDPGPLVGPFTWGFLVLAVLSFVFARDYLRASEGPGKRALLLVALAVGFETLLTVGSAVAWLVVDPGSYARAGPAAHQRYVFLAAAIPLGAAAWLLLRRRRADAPPRREVRFGLATWAAALLFGAFVVRPEVAAGDALGVAGAGYGLARLLVALTLAYAVLRGRLFGLDVKLKWTIRRGTVAAVFIAFFFVVAEVAENVVSESFGLLLGGVSAGLLLFAIQPLQRMADRIANAAMPGVVDPRQVAATAGKEDAYRAAVEMALADGLVTRPEERALAKLAHELGLAGPRALELREEVEASRGPAGAP